MNLTTNRLLVLIVVAALIVLALIGEDQASTTATSPDPMTYGAAP